MARTKLLARLVKRLPQANPKAEIEFIPSLSTGKRTYSQAKQDELAKAAELAKVRLGLAKPPKPEPIVDELAQSVRLPTINRRL